MSRILHGRQRGFGLIELMIAVAMGLFITAVIGSLFLGSRRTYAATEDMGRLQENMRFAYQLLSRTVHLTGYKSSPNSVTSVIFSGANAAISALEGTGTASDTLTIRFQGSSDSAGVADGSIVDCTGQEIAGGVMATSVLAIAPGASGQNALFCNGAEVVPDVENMQILYGEDINGDLVADRYVTISDVASSDNIITARVALLFQTPGSQAAVTPDTTTYNLNGTLLGPYNDRRIRRLLILNLNLRNRTP